MKEWQENKSWWTDAIDQYEEVWVCEYCGKEFIEENKCEYHEKYCNSKYKKQIYISHDYDHYEEDDYDNF